MDPEVRAFLEGIASSGMYPVTGDPLDIRTRYNGVPVPAIEGILRIEDIDIASDGGTLRIRAYTAVDDDHAPALLAFHGGGWVVGDLLWMEGQCRNLAKAAGCKVFSVEYRLAPEARFPAPVEDAYAALTFLAANAKHLGVDTNRIAVYGQSAGGNLAASLALLTRDRGGPALALQIPVYPVLAADFESPSYLEYGAGPGLTREQMEWYWDLYVDPVDRDDPYVSPIHAASLAGVAPALVIGAEADVLQHEGKAYAERLEADGVVVTYSMYAGMHHGFLNLTQVFPKAQAAFDEIVIALRGCFGLD
jgi:acetyl esterase